LAGDKSSKIYSTEDTISYYEEALKRLHKMPDTKTNKGKRVDLFIRQARVMRLMGRFKEHIKTLEKNLPIVKKLRDKDRLAEYYFKMGFYYSVMGDLNNATKNLNSSIELAEVISNERIAGLAIPRLGLIYWYKGEPSKGFPYVKKAINILENIGDTYWLARSFQIIGMFYWMTGQWNKSIEYMQKLERKSEEISDVSLKSLTSWSKAIPHLDKGEWDVGIDYCKKNLDISPSPLYSVFNIGVLGYGYFKKDEFEKAIEHLEKAVQQSKNFGLRHQQAQFSAYLAEAYLSNNNKDNALEVINNILGVIRESGYKYWEGVCYRILGDLCDKSESKKAKEHIEDSIKILKKVGANNELAKSYFSLGKLYKAEGERDKAKKYVTQALKLFEKLGTLHEPEKAREVLKDLR
jgi:tetratricopeptide (TPR) repeat protein